MTGITLKVCAEVAMRFWKDGKLDEGAYREVLKWPIPTESAGYRVCRCTRFSKYLEIKKMALKIKRAPTHLKTEGRKFWKHVLRDFDLVDAHHLKDLELSCQCLDRIEEARIKIETEGSYFRDRFGQPKESPWCKAERDNKVLFARLLRELSLDLNIPEESRPPAQY